MKISKKLIGLVLPVLLFTFGASVTMAMDANPNDKIGFKIKQTEESQKVNVYLFNLLDLPTKMKVKTSSGDVVYRKTIKNEIGYAIALDLSRLPEGNYSITVEQEGIRVVKHLELNRNDIVFGGTETWKFEEAPTTETDVAVN